MVTILSGGETGGKENFKQTWKDGYDLSIWRWEALPGGEAVLQIHSLIRSWLCNNRKTQLSIKFSDMEENIYEDVIKKTWLWGRRDSFLGKVMCQLWSEGWVDKNKVKTWDDRGNISRWKEMYVNPVMVEASQVCATRRTSASDLFPGLG